MASWAALRRELQSEFSVTDHDERLLSEIRGRTQGQSEASSLFIATMLNYFSRLIVPLSEAEQLVIIRRNLRPRLNLALALETVSSIRVLKEKCRLLEGHFSSASGFREPPRVTDHMIAPDPAYAGSKVSPKVEAVQPVRDAGLFCVRGRIDSHSLSSCPSRDLVCFGCGNPVSGRLSAPSATRT